MQFSKFAKGSPNSKDKGKAPEPEVEDLKDASPEPAPEPESSGGALSILDDSPEAEGASLLAMAEAASSEGGGGGMLFPVIQISGGESGGQYKLLGEVPKEAARMFMPVTSDDPVEGVLVGYRVEMIAWPAGKKSDEGSTTTPAWSAVLPATAVASARDLFLKASEAFNFTKGADKHKFDFDASDVGHLRPSFQALVFVPNPGGIIVVQPPALHGSWLESAETLAKLVDPKTRKLGRFPVRIYSKSRAVKYSAHSNKIHRLVFDKATDSEGAEWVQTFQQWREHVIREDPETVQSIETWLRGEDAPLNEAALERLEKAKGMAPQR